MSQRANYLYTRYTGTSAIQLGTGVGLLHTVTVNGSLSGAIALVDRNTGTDVRGTIATLRAENVSSYLYDCQFNAGLRVEMPLNSLTTGPDVTITWCLGL